MLNHVNPGGKVSASQQNELIDQALRNRFGGGVPSQQGSGGFALVQYPGLEMLLFEVTQEFSYPEKPENSYPVVDPTPHGKGQILHSLRNTDSSESIYDYTSSDPEYEIYLPTAKLDEEGYPIVPSTKLTTEDRIWAAFNRENGRWEVVSHCNTDGEAFCAKATEDWRGPESVGPFEVECQRCDLFGDVEDPSSDPITINLIGAPGKHPEVYEDQVILCTKIKDGTYISTGHCNSSLGEVRDVRFMESELPKGWVFCDGAQLPDDRKVDWGTALDMRGRFAVGMPGSSVSTYNEQGGFSHQPNVGDTSGYAWHGSSINDHSQHSSIGLPNHKHRIDFPMYYADSITFQEGLGASMLLGIGSVISSSISSNDYSDSSLFQHTKTDNRPPFTVVRRIERYK